ncbi:(2Fe-2S)-binding protein [Pseudoduganella umbonata]|uniref:(2Fe-2S)-binding protein n=1 Tax=Pseudoduganella umbonata TaxID=864828 RepID=A0A4P8HVG2_9BURK|nr:(2Fe-2S)-binding protein [Pseudoduganella umbonata]MBB3224094.1 isoquinoline 1-oxidoreductase alpha subunit [Pseudoduganella umbonata]QCP14039.1 (2Fe-2S)-binding protein [Pseudoduganella umbonata]
MIEVLLNGQAARFDADGEMPLLWALRDIAHLTGTKFGCGMALCGACTVHVDGEPTRACVTPLRSVADRSVTTIEGIGATAEGRSVQDAWIKVDVPQCGYCQSGQIMSATALLQRVRKPSEAQITEAMNGNICRCGTYARIRTAIKLAAGKAE